MAADSPKIVINILILTHNYSNVTVNSKLAPSQEKRVSVRPVRYSHHNI